jgi:hypothetical protein
MKPAVPCTTTAYMPPVPANQSTNNYHVNNLSNMLLQHHHSHFGGLQTPKDGNCSFSKCLNGFLTWNERAGQRNPPKTHIF